MEGLEAFSIPRLLLAARKIPRAWQPGQQWRRNKSAQRASDRAATGSWKRAMMTPHFPTAPHSQAPTALGAQDRMEESCVEGRRRERWRGRVGEGGRGSSS